jgi:hypothetical protein
VSDPLCHGVVSARSSTCASVIDVYWTVRQMIAVVETEEFLADVKPVSRSGRSDNRNWGPSKAALGVERKGKTGWFAGDLLLSQYSPLFLMAIYTKHVQADLSMNQRRALSAQLRALKRDWKEKKTK